MIIGLTGGIGSGKSTVAHFFRELKVTVLDADQITRELVQPNQAALKEIVQYFGASILQKNGTLNRKKLREIVFKNPKDRVWLEKLLHPLVKQQILNSVKNKEKNNYIVVEIPLLIEAHFQDIVDRILVIDCPESLQIQRITTRDQVSTKQVQAIAKTQIERSIRLKEADDIIVNDSTIDELKKKVEAYHLKYIELSK